mmetsp:Transcript_18689/g.33656  ORF Transcript_18689/g.33656 Transcript_18689/m.33656 type:complete len:271 (+) Transcript_18689:149-961(+)
MQLQYSIINLILPNNKTDIHLRCTLAHHLHLDPVHAKHSEHGRQHVRTPGHVSDERQYRPSVMQLHLSEGAQVLDERFNILLVLLFVQGDRDGNLGRGEHVHAHLVLLEVGEYRAEESVRAEHLERVDIHQRYAALARDGCDHPVGIAHLIDHASWCRWIVRILNPHGNVRLQCRLHGDGMQHLRAEVGEFGGLLVRYLGYGDGGFDETGVGGEDAVDVLPDLDFVDLEGGADGGCGEVGSSASEGCYSTFGVVPNKSSYHCNHIGIDPT